MAAPVILVEATPRRAVDGVAVTVRLAGGGANQPYHYGGEHWRAGIARLPTIVTQLDFDGKDLGGGGLPQALQINWSPASSAALAALAAHHWIDAVVTVRTGPEGSMPPVVVTGTVLDVACQGGSLQLAMADPAASLKRPVLTDRFAGTGGIEGPVEFAGLLKSRAWGPCFNVVGRVIDQANNIWVFGDPMRQWQAFDDVRDGGASADPTALTVLAWQGSAAATFTALQAAAAPAGGGVLAPSIACLKWWSSEPFGDLHADIRGEIAGGYVDTAPEIATRIVAARSTIPFAIGTVAAATAARPARYGWRVEDESTTAADVLSKVLGDVSLSWVLIDGAIVLRPWAWGAATASARSEGVTRRETFVPVGTRRLGYQRNWHQMARGDLVASVLADEADPDVLTPEKKYALHSQLLASDAWWNALSASYAALTVVPASGSPLDAAYVDAATARADRADFLEAIDPAYDTLTVSSPVYRAGLMAAMQAVDDALAVLDAALNGGAVAGSIIGGGGGAPGVEAGELVARFETAEQQLTNLALSADAAVADGVVTGLEKPMIAADLLLNDRSRLEIQARGTAVNVSTAAVDTAFTAWKTYVESRPDWADPAMPSTINATVYRLRKNAFLTALGVANAAINAVLAGGLNTDNAIFATIDTKLVGNSGSGPGVTYTTSVARGGAHLRVRLLPTTTAAETWAGLAAKENATSYGTASMTFGFALIKVGDDMVLAVVKDGAVTIWNDGETFNDGVTIQVDQFDVDSEYGSVVFLRALESTLRYIEPIPVLPGQDLVGKVLIFGAGAFSGLAFHGATMMSFGALAGEKPPIDATNGAGVIRDQDFAGTGVTKVAAPVGAPAGSAWRFAGNGQLILSWGSAATGFKAPVGSQPYLLFSAWRQRNGVVAGDLYAIIDWYDSTAAAQVGVPALLDLSVGDGPYAATAAVPAGAAYFVSTITSALTGSGSIELAAIDIVPTATAIAVEAAAVPPIDGAYLFANASLRLPNAANAAPAGLKSYIASSTWNGSGYDAASYGGGNSGMTWGYRSAAGLAGGLRYGVAGDATIRRTFGADRALLNVVLPAIPVQPNDKLTLALGQVVYAATRNSALPAGKTHIAVYALDGETVAADARVLLVPDDPLEPNVYIYTPPAGAKFVSFEILDIEAAAYTIIAGQPSYTANVSSGYAAFHVQRGTPQTLAELDPVAAAAAALVPDQFAAVGDAAAQAAINAAISVGSDNLIPAGDANSAIAGQRIELWTGQLIQPSNYRWRGWVNSDAPASIVAVPPASPGVERTQFVDADPTRPHVWTATLGAASTHMLTERFAIEPGRSYAFSVRISAKNWSQLSDVKIRLRLASTAVNDAFLHSANCEQTVLLASYATLDTLTGGVEVWTDVVPDIWVAPAGRAWASLEVSCGVPTGGGTPGALVIERAIGAKLVDWSDHVVGVKKPEDSADVTATSIPGSQPVGDVFASATANATVMVIDSFNTTYVYPNRLKGSVDVRADDGCSWSLTMSPDITATIENTDGDPLKGRIMVTDMARSIGYLFVASDYNDVVRTEVITLYRQVDFRNPFNETVFNASGASTSFVPISPVVRFTGAPAYTKVGWMFAIPAADGGYADNGVLPEAKLQYSNDGGASWSDAAAAIGSGEASNYSAGGVRVAEAARFNGSADLSFIGLPLSTLDWRWVGRTPDANTSLATPYGGWRLQP